jgi:ABC-type transport system substrate-binding protein
MKKLTKLPAAVLCAVLIVSMLAACSAPSGNNDDSSAAAPSENNADSSAAAPGASEPSSDGKVTVTIGHITELTDLDRFANYGSGGDDTGLLWADPLIFSNHLGTYTPALALEWSVSDDYLAYTFKLREGVKFHDGSEFTSFDVKRTFERMFED